jgi:putative SOS response-associated peptidase YedK
MVGPPGMIQSDGAEPEQLKVLLASYPAEDMKLWPVSTRVGNVRNSDPSMIEEVAAIG